MKENNERYQKDKSADLSKVYINYQGRLCEVDDMQGITVNRIHNCIKCNSEAEVFFGFDPKYVTQSGW